MPFRQALFALRWFHEAGCVHRLAPDAGIPLSQAQVEHQGITFTNWHKQGEGRQQPR